jgi:hypothetical protein
MDPPRGPVRADLAPSQGGYSKRACTFSTPGCSGRPGQQKSPSNFPNCEAEVTTNTHVCTHSPHQSPSSIFLNGYSSFKVGFLIKKIYLHTYSICSVTFFLYNAFTNFTWEKVTSKADRGSLCFFWHQSSWLYPRDRCECRRCSERDVFNTLKKFTSIAISPNALFTNKCLTSSSPFFLVITIIAPVLCSLLVQWFTSVQVL